MKKTQCRPGTVNALIAGSGMTIPCASLVMLVFLHLFFAWMLLCSHTGPPQPGPWLLVTVLL